MRVHLGARHDLQTLDHAGHQLVLQTRVLAFRLFAHDDEVKRFLVSSLDPFHALQMNRMR